MGADMLLAIAASPQTISGSSEVSVAAMCGRARERFEATFSEGDLEPEFYPELLEDGSGEAAERVAAALASWIEGGGLDSREVAHVRIGGRAYIATGGLSWGDPPTDAFSYVSLLGDIRAFDEPLA